MGRNEQNARAQLLMRALSTTNGVRIAEFARRNDLRERTVRRDLQGLEQSGLPIAEVEPAVTALIQKCVSHPRLHYCPTNY